MRRLPYIWLSMLTLLIAAGCAATRRDEGRSRPPVAPVVAAPVPVVTRPAAPAGDSDRLLAYFEHVRRLSSAELAKEHDATRQLYSNVNSDFVRVRYAMLLSVPGAAFSDDARALEALEPVLKNPQSALHGIAFIVNAQVQERQRGHALQQKLDALKSLEKSLIERDPGAGKRK